MEGAVSGVNMFQSLGATGESLSNVPAVHESVNTTYLSYKLKLKGGCIVVAKKTYSLGPPALQRLWSSEVQFALVNIERKPRDVPDARQGLELVMFVATRTSYGIGTLRL